MTCNLLNTIYVQGKKDPKIQIHENSRNTSTEYMTSTAKQNQWRTVETPLKQELVLVVSLQGAVKKGGLSELQLQFKKKVTQLKMSLYY